MPLLSADVALNLVAVMAETSCLDDAAMSRRGTHRAIVGSLAMTLSRNGVVAMAISNSFPPDIEKDAEEVRNEAGATVRSLRDKAGEMAGRAGEAVKDGYARAKEAVSEAAPLETARQGGQAVAGAVERHPLAAFGLGALSVGLIAWAAMRSSAPASRWERYQPDYGRWRNWLQDSGSGAADAGDRAWQAGGKWLRSHRQDAEDYADRASDYAARARGYADLGGRMLVKRAEREPVAALIGAGIAVYLIGSLLTAASGRAEDTPPAPRRRTGKR
jgi:hypothetical protein